MGWRGRDHLGGEGALLGLQPRTLYTRGKHFALNYIPWVWGFVIVVCCWDEVSLCHLKWAEFVIWLPLAPKQLGLQTRTVCPHLSGSEPRGGRKSNISAAGLASSLPRGPQSQPPFHALPGPRGLLAFFGLWSHNSSLPRWSPCFLLCVQSPSFHILNIHNWVYLGFIILSELSFLNHICKDPFSSWHSKRSKVYKPLLLGVSLIQRF